LKEEYLGAEGPWLVNNTELQSLAYNVTGDESNVLTIIKNLVAWIAANIQYEAHEVPQYPDETLTSRRGDCDDQAILLITLSRIVGIPAFLQVGALYKQSQLNTSYWKDHVDVVQKNIGWHGWAIIYIPPWGWLPVDLTYIFGGLRGDPLNAITNAAVTRQSTIQYMNISRTDQVASSQESREFLQTNNFYVYIEDEMVDVTPPRNPLGESGEQLIPLILIIAVALSLASSYFVANRFRRKREKETNSSIDKY
jgi:transglutaminase-like putative cysteine protease